MECGNVPVKKRWRFLFGDFQCHIAMVLGFLYAPPRPCQENQEHWTDSQVPPGYHEALYDWDAGENMHFNMFEKEEKSCFTPHETYQLRQVFVDQHNDKWQVKTGEEEPWEETARMFEETDFEKDEGIPEEKGEQESTAEEKLQEEKTGGKEDRIEEEEQGEEAEDEEEKQREKAEDQEEKQSEKAQGGEEVMGWPGKVKILDSTGLQWKFWDNTWWLGFPIEVEDQMPENEVGDDWSIHSDVASTVYPPEWPSDWEGELAALEAEKKYPNCGKNPALKEKIMQHKEESKKRRADKAEAEKQESKVPKVDTKKEEKKAAEKKEEADMISWAPLTSKGFSDFLKHCSGHLPEVERSEPLPELQSKKHSKSGERNATVKWGPCTKQGKASFLRVFALQAPENMTLPDLLAYSHKIKDFNEIPCNTPSFVVETIKNIVELYDTWGVAEPKKVDYWLRIRLGVRQNMLSLCCVLSVLQTAD